MFRVPRFFKDPLLHFLIVGAGLLYLGNVLAPAEPDEEKIVVDRAALLEFIQYRSKAFEPAAAASLLDSMDMQRRGELVSDYVEEEALYREAKKLGLETGDYVIKQRLVQKMNFMADASVDAPPLTEEEIAAFYEANKANYYIEPSATFTHVFFNAKTRGERKAENDAARMTTTLNRQKAPFEDAVKHGDRFIFDTNYVERTFDYVAAQFGEDAAKEIFKADGPFNAWRGPVLSPYGAHVIDVAEVTPGRTPSLDEVRDRVVEDATRERKAVLARKTIDGIVASYGVVIDLNGMPAQGGAPAVSAE